MPSNFGQFIQNNLRDIVVSSLLFSTSIFFLAVFYGRTGSLYELLSKLAFALLIAVVVRLTTVFLYGKKYDQSTFESFGMKAVHKDLSTHQVGKFLKNARNIDVMKTWFPDHPDLREGLQGAFTNRNRRTTVRLLLCHPDSDLLRARSTGAGEDADHGSREVTRTLRDLYDCTQRTTATFEIRLYHGWPGCPIIWYDQHVLVGFYLRGRPSPFWPWIEVEANSRFDEILRRQFDELWGKTTDKISDRDRLGEWLKDRGQLNEERQPRATQGKTPPDPAMN